jgi:phosphoesterase RecJ-like protein
MKAKYDFKELQKLIEAHQSFFIISHIYTDGDALGSILALKLYLQRLGKKVEAVVPGKIPAQYAFLGVHQHINCMNETQTLQFIEQADVIFILDISALQRMDRWYKPVMQSRSLKVCLDHHPEGCADVDWQIVDVQRIATAEIIYDFFKANGVELNKEMALALYTAILTDSGSFRFEGTSTFTLRMAAELTRYGIDPAWVYRKVYEHSNKAQLRFWGHVLTHLQSEGTIDWAVVPKSTLQKFGVTIEDMNGLVDIIRRDATATIFVMFVENSNSEIMVGLRSKDNFDVGAIARSFGGGGHFHAAGFSSSKPMDVVVQETLQAIKEKQNGKQA